MAQLRRDSKLRERLQMLVHEAQEQVHSTQYSIDYYRQQLSLAMAHETEVDETEIDERERAKASIEAEIHRLERQLVTVRLKLDVAKEELEDFEDTTREASRRGEEGK
jgi:chromosome segregation ATPase